jgi:hypothetical protein
MPLWQDAARCVGAAAGLGKAAIGLAGAGNSCCADAVDESTRNPARVAITTRNPDEGIGIGITGSRANFTVPEYLKPA